MFDCCLVGTAHYFITMPSPSIIRLIVPVAALCLIEEASSVSVEDSTSPLDDTSPIFHPASVFILLVIAYYTVTSSSSIIWRLPLICLTILRAVCFWLDLSIERGLRFLSSQFKSQKKKKKVWKKPKARMKVAKAEASSRCCNGNDNGCNHGFDPSNTYGGLDHEFECVLFIKIWLHATMWGSESIDDWLASYFLMTATKQFLNGNIEMASLEASKAYTHEQFKEIELDKSKPKFDLDEFVRICYADKPALAAFLRKRIPCECLD